MTTHGMTEDTARAIVQVHEPELVEWATTTLARKLKAKEPVENPAGWLRKAIEEDWRPQPTLFAQEKAQARETERQNEREQLEQQVKTAKRRKADTARERIAIATFINDLPKEEREALEQDFHNHLSTGPVPLFVVRKFNGGASWYADPLITRSAIEFLTSTRPDFSDPRSHQRQASIRLQS